MTWTAKLPSELSCSMMSLKGQLRSDWDDLWYIVVTLCAGFGFSQGGWVSPHKSSSHVSVLPGHEWPGRDFSDLGVNI